MQRKAAVVWTHRFGPTVSKTGVACALAANRLSRTLKPARSRSGRPFDAAFGVAVL